MDSYANFEKMLGASTYTPLTIMSFSFLVLWPFMMWFLNRYLKLTTFKSFLWSGVVVMCGFGFSDLNNSFFSNTLVLQYHDWAVGIIIFRGLLLLFLLPFLFHLYQKWYKGYLTDDEKSPGMKGIAAWLSAGNLFCCGMISLSARLGYGYSFWGVLAVTLAICGVYPLFNTWVKFTSQPIQETEDLSKEREKVLQLLEMGKINAQECAELLNVLNPKR